MALLVDLETISLPAATAVAPSGTDVSTATSSRTNPPASRSPTIARFPLEPDHLERR